MRGDIQRPHDRLFRSVFADPHEAATFLRPHLPPALVERFDWSSLALEETSFVDEALQESESALLYMNRIRSRTRWRLPTSDTVAPHKVASACLHISAHVCAAARVDLRAADVDGSPTLVDDLRPGCVRRLHLAHMDVARRQ